MQLSGPIVYSAAGTSGSGGITSGPYPGNAGVESFDAIAAPGPLESSIYANLSDDLPGHYLGGPSAGPSCD